MKTKNTYHIPAPCIECSECTECIEMSIPVDVIQTGHHLVGCLFGVVGFGVVGGHGSRKRRFGRVEGSDVILSSKIPTCYNSHQLCYNSHQLYYKSHELTDVNCYFGLSVLVDDLAHPPARPPSQKKSDNVLSTTMPSFGKVCKVFQIF